MLVNLSKLILIILKKLKITRYDIIKLFTSSHLEWKVLPYQLCAYLPILAPKLHNIWIQPVLESLILTSNKSSNKKNKK